LKNEFPFQNYSIEQLHFEIYYFTCVKFCNVKKLSYFFYLCFNHLYTEGDEKIIVNPIEYDSSIPNISFGEFILEKVKQFGEKVSLVSKYL